MDHVDPGKDQQETHPENIGHVGEQGQQEEGLVGASADTSRSMPHLTPYQDNGAGDEIQPNDSISQAGGRAKNAAGSDISVKTTASVLAIRNKQREVELAARSAALQRRNKLEQRKRLLQRELELQEAQDEIRHAQERALMIRRRQEMEEKAKQIEQEQEEIELDAELHAAREISRILEQPENLDSFSQTPKKLSEEIANGTSPELTQTEPLIINMQESHGQLNPDANPFYLANGEVKEAAAIDEAPVPIPVQKHVDKSTSGECCNPEHKTEMTQLSMEMILNKIVDNQKEAALPSAELDSFDGSNVLSYLSFIKNFKYVVEDKTQDAARRLELLLKYTKGEAHELIKECPMIDPATKGYERAKWLLKRDYGQPPILAAAYKTKAEEWTKIPLGDKVALKKFAIFLVNCCNAKCGNTEMSSMDGYEFLRILASKLPTSLQQQWIRQVGKFREEKMRSPTLEDFEQFVGQLSRNENDPRIAGLGYQLRSKDNRSSASHIQKPQKGPAVAAKKVFATTVSHTSESRNPQTKPKGVTTGENKAAKAPCLLCGDGTNHCILDCRKFAALEPKTKSEFCLKKGMCFSCLNPGHLKTSCPNKELAKCSKCQKQHVTAMHDPERHMKKSPDETQENKQKEAAVQIKTGCVGIQTETCGSIKVDKTSPLMAILPVLVKAKSSDKCIATYAFVDNGSGAVFSDVELSRRLKTKTKKTRLMLKTLNLEHTFDTEMILDELQVGSIDGANFIDLPTVYIKDKIPVNTDDAPTQGDLDRWSHLRDIQLPKLQGSNIPHVTLMIGMNVPAASTPLQMSCSKIGEPYAIKSPLGWLVYGLPGKLKYQNDVNVNFCRINNISLQNAQDNLEQQFQQYVNMEFSERLSDGQQQPSENDKKFLSIMEGSIKKVDGHYQTALPIRNRDVKLPDSRLQAEVYAGRLRKRLMKNEVLKQQYTEFMTNLTKKGYAEKVPQQTQPNERKVWYVPHHGVHHPRKPDKIRVVFNCPAKVEGTSLNDQLLQGPDMTNLLYGVFIRWRKEPVAVMTDIRVYVLSSVSKP